MKRRQFLIAGGIVMLGTVGSQGCRKKTTDPEFPVSIVQTVCTGCGSCVPYCPHNAITLVESDGSNDNAYTAVIDQNLCTTCLTCLSECAYDAIRFHGF